MKNTVIHSEADLEALIEEIGFLPFFRNGISGFSVEELISPELWFSSEEDGPWEWKGPVINAIRCAYGKFFRSKAGFISQRWYPDFANLRRDGYDFDARYDDGMAAFADKEIYERLAESGSMMSYDLKSALGYSKNGRKGFDGIISRLQMQGYVITENFEYRKDRFGNRYGWGVARYTTPERFFGDCFCENVYKREPRESGALIMECLSKAFPSASEKDLAKLLGI